MLPFFKQQLTAAVSGVHNYFDPQLIPTPVIISSSTPQNNINISCSKMSSRSQNDVILYLFLGRRIVPGKKGATTRKERNREYAKVEKENQIYFNIFKLASRQEW
jgi:hypothetical protein